jgi:hypothetical protein
MPEGLSLFNLFGKRTKPEQSQADPTKAADRDWVFPDSSLTSYETTFYGVLHGKKIKTLIENNPHPVVLDLMASPRALWDLLQPIRAQEKTGIAVGDKEIRNEETTEVDKEQGISQIIGDITKSETWEKIEQELGGKKVDLIMERGLGALEDLPNRPLYFASVLQRMWRILGENGVILLEMPRKKPVDPKAFAKALTEIGIEAHCDSINYCMLIKRNPSSPNIIPFPQLNLLNKTA